MRRAVTVALIAAGSVLLLTGELLGVFSPHSYDTVTEFVTWFTVNTYGVGLVAVLAGLGWVAYHFTDEYRKARRER